MTAQPCRTGKKRYPNERAARVRLVEIRARRVLRNVRRRREERAYLCPFCFGWHLTSAPDTRGEKGAA